jgi:lipopolysaccharide transport system ATP-binding protein
LSDELAIRLSDVTKRYYLGSPVAEGLKHLLLHLPSQIKAMRARRPFDALANVSLDVRAGECLGLIGHNGAGKSTALGLIAGVLKPTSGRVETFGRVCPLLELGAGFSHELTGRENIALNGILLGLTRQEVQERTADIIAFSELHDFIDAPLRTYSSGMTIRLGFSVAVHLDPDILLIDEVLAVGDARFQAKCLERMEQFRRRGTTMVFVSHDLASVERVCDRVALFEAGRMIELGAAGQVIASYQHRARAA